MFKYLLLPFLFIFCLKTTAQTSFKKEFFNGTKAIVSNSVQQNSDGTFIIAGRIDTVINAIRGNSAFLKKTDSFGNLIWTKYYSFANTYGLEFSKIIKTKDNNYVVLGMIDYGFGIDDRFQDAFIAKIDATGNMLWYNNYGGFGGDEGVDVKELADGNLALFNLYHTLSNNNLNATFQLVKINTEGKTLWQHDYAHGNALVEEFANSITQTSDGGFIMVGELNDQNDPYSRGYILKTDSLGAEAWVQKIELPSSNYSSIMSVNSNQGNFTIIGKVYNVSLQQTFIANYSNAGVLNWRKDMDTKNNQAIFATATKDGGFAAITIGLDTINHMMLLKTDNLGNLLYQKEIPILTTNNLPLEITSTADNSLIITGGSLSFNPYSIFIAKIADTKTSSIEKINTLPISIYPNPVEQTLYVNIPNIETSQLKTLSIFTIQGALIKTININQLQNQSIDCSNFIAGKYFISCYNNENELVKTIPFLKK